MTRATEGAGSELIAEDIRASMCSSWDPEGKEEESGQERESTADFVRADWPTSIFGEASATVNGLAADAFGEPTTAGMRNSGDSSPAVPTRTVRAPSSSTYMDMEAARASAIAEKGGLSVRSTRIVWMDRCMTWYNVAF